MRQKTFIINQETYGRHHTSIQQRFETSKWRRMLKFAHIRLENNAAAQKAMRDLEQGHPFDQVAKEHSLEPTTAARGGVLDHYYGRGNLKDLGMSTEIAEILFELEVGQFSQPILWGDYYEIFKILDEAPAPDHYKVSFVRGEYWEEFQNAWQTLVAELKQRFDVRLDQETIAFLVNRMSTSANRGVMLSPEEQEMVLCRFKGGQLTLKDFAGTYNSLWFFRSVYFDSSGITDFIHRDILPRAMVYHAALQENVDKEPTVATWLANKKEALLLETLRTKDVVEQVRIDSAMVRDYYDSHLNLFMQFEEFDMVEILVKTRQQAEALVQQIKDGQDLETLAAQYSIRQDSTGGRFHMHNHASERRVYGHLYDAVLAAEIGELTGPIAMDEGYSIFKVLKKIDRQPASFEVSASRATWWLKKQEERRLFDALFVRLREKHASSTVMYEDRLEKLLID